MRMMFSMNLAELDQKRRIHAKTPGNYLVFVAPYFLAIFV